MKIVFIEPARSIPDLAEMGKYFSVADPLQSGYNGVKENVSPSPKAIWNEPMFLRVKMR